MSKMAFDWKPNSRFPVGAQVAAERLSKIREQAGALTPRAVVEDAKHDNSPLHPCFEWDDVKAADSHRLWQARQLIGSLVIVEVADKPVERETRAFVHLSSETVRYEPLAVAVGDAEMRAELVARLKGEIGRWRARLAAFQEFASIVSKLDEALAELTAG